MIQRNLAPAFKQVESIDIIRAHTIRLDNNVELYTINAGEQKLVKIEWIFDNTAWDRRHPLQAFATCSMLLEGTSGMTAHEIAEKIDFYGAFLDTEFNYDYSSLVLYSLTKHLKYIFPIVHEVLTNASFPDQELKIFAKNQQQKLLVHMERNEFVARREFQHSLFNDSVYGYRSSPEDYDHISQDELLAYFRSAYQASNCRIIASGKVDDEVVLLINNYFGEKWNVGVKPRPATYTFNECTVKDIFVDVPDSLQSAIRIGGLAIKKDHVDYSGLQVLNTVLGGYFGSRLMANIREDKGYTYGIGSALVSLRHSGYMFIASEVKAEVCGDTLLEIEKEINRLRAEPVSIEELNLVKNFMLGSMLGSLENAFSHADKLKSLLFAGLDYSFYDRYILRVRQMTSDELQALAIKYLDYSLLNKVIVGKQ